MEEAEQHADDAVRLDPEEIRYRELLAQVLAAGGAHREAAEEFNRLARNDPRQSGWTLAEAEERLGAAQPGMGVEAARQPRFGRHSRSDSPEDKRLYLRSRNHTREKPIRTMNVVARDVTIERAVFRCDNGGRKQIHARLAMMQTQSHCIEASSYIAPVAGSQQTFFTEGKILPAYAKIQRAMIGGALASWMTAAIAGILL